MELTPENWEKEFGTDGIVNTPVGEVKMGENQYLKLAKQGRDGKLGMIKPTLETPDVIIEDKSKAKDGQTTERESSYIFIKAFQKQDGSRFYYFTSVTVAKDNREVVISNQEKGKSRISNLLQKGNILWKYADDISATSDVGQGLYSDSEEKTSDSLSEGTDAPQSISEDKVTTKNETDKENKKKINQQSTDGIDGIRRRYEQTNKKEGHKGTKVLPNGEKIKGRYVLIESTGITPSHDIQHNFAQSEGFPTREDGTTLNDRDYEKDKQAQNQVIQRSTQYDGRAVTDMPIVDNNGIVLSGNDRTMSGQLSAMQNKDGAYLESLKENAQMYGFTREDVEAMQHPRLVFILDNNMDYTTENFAKFNQNEKKSQNNIEKAVKVGKTIKPETIRQIAQVIDNYDSIAECLSDKKGVNDILTFLERDGQIQRNDVEQYLNDGIFNESGKEYIQTVLIGATLNEESVRMINAMPFMKKTVVTALNQILQNAKLGDYSLREEIDEAIKTVYEAHKQSGVKQGEDLKKHYTQLGIFGESNIKSKTVQLLSDLLNSEKVRKLKKVLISYNENAQDSANGQVDMFSVAGQVKNKEQILEETIKGIQDYEQRNRTKQSLNVGNGGKRESDSGRITGKQSEPDGRGSQTTSQTDTSARNEEVKQQKITADTQETTAEDKALLDAVVDKLKEAIGEENVIIDNAEAQRILDQVNGEDVRFQNTQDVEQVNKQFNEELQQQIDGTLPKDHIYQLGYPSSILQSTGFPNAPIELSSSHLQKKAEKSYHKYEIEDVEELVNALQKTIAIFE